MSVIGSNILAGASGQGGGYNLTNSLRFRSSASAYLSRTFGSATSTTTGTFSFWMKRGKLSTNYQYLWSASNYDLAYFDSSDNLWIAYLGNLGYVNTNAVFRDPSAWYHIMIVFDTTNATAANRLQVYVNGVAQSLNWGSTPQTQNATFQRWNVSGYTGDIGDVEYNHTGYFDGYFAEYYWIDGQALAPSSFGETSTSTGVWIPKKFSGTYGTNGFYLKFTDTTSTSTLGTDFSGNSNTWTVNNISLTAGTTYDSMTDVPTLTSATAANYCVLNPLMTGSFATLSNANLTITGNTATNSGASIGSMASTTGKFYWELVCTNVATTALGVGATTVQLTSSALNDAEAYATNYGFKVRSSGSKEGIAGEIQTFTMPSFTTGDVIGIAVDADNGAIYVSKNGTYVNSGSPTSGASKTGSCYNYTPSSSRPIAPMYGAYINDVGAANFGQRPFAYTPPSGFVALNTFNLPTPTIGATASTTANKYFDITLWTGDGSTSTRTFTNSGSMQPDWVWTKSRSGAWAHNIFDSVRGFANDKGLNSNLTDAEGTNRNGYVSAANSNGFSMANGTSGNQYYNENNTTYVGWQWRASNTTPVSNTAGSITSTVSASTTAGFSIVTYTGTGVNATVGHGLGVAPSMIICKNRIDGTTLWSVYHSSVGAASVAHLNQTSAFSASGDWNSTTPTSTVFSVGSSSRTNASTQGIVAYCFAQVAGYSAFGSYTGNGSSDGPFIFTGFRPRYLMIKRTDATQNWAIVDTSRDTFNVSNKRLFANLSDAEDTGISNFVDLLSNGFKFRDSNVSCNASGGTYIYMAFAENPFKYANAR
jgi:hypothetical protein